MKTPKKAYKVTEQEQFLIQMLRNFDDKQVGYAYAVLEDVSRKMRSAASDEQSSDLVQGTLNKLSDVIWQIQEVQRHER